MDVVCKLGQNTNDAHTLNIRCIAATAVLCFSLHLFTLFQISNVRFGRMSSFYCDRFIFFSLKTQLFISFFSTFKIVCILFFGVLLILRCTLKSVLMNSIAIGNLMLLFSKATCCNHVL